MTMRKNNRPDHTGVHETEYKKNKAKILMREEVCYICGRPIDKTLRYPNPMSASIDHIMPISRGGHPSAINNLALAHLRCNRLKSNNIAREDLVRFDAVEDASYKPDNKRRQAYQHPHLMDWS